MKNTFALIFVMVLVATSMMAEKLTNIGESASPEHTIIIRK